MFKGTLSMGKYFISYSETHDTIAIYNAKGSVVRVEDIALGGISNLSELYKSIKVLYSDASREAIRAMAYAIMSYFEPNWYLVKL